LEDYVYTRSIDRAGWAWEFLRRNKYFGEDLKCHGDNRNVRLIEHDSIHCIEMGQRNVAAEKWRLLTFASLDLDVRGPQVFWDADSLPQLLYFTSKHPAKIGQGNFELNCIAGQKSILRLDGVEYVVIQRSESSVRLAGTGCSLMSGSCDIKFEIAGIRGIVPQLDAIKTLARFARENDENSETEEQRYPLLLSYLIALDGHLEGKTYRQIAQVIYGEDRVCEVWTSETRFMKDKIRRAVERGIAYMERDYLTLLQ
jgi:hypothetical protein